MSDMREQIAAIVYAGIKWGCDNAETSPAPDWVPRGNSLAQDEARKQADTIIAAMAPKEVTTARALEIVLSRLKMDPETARIMKSHLGNERSAFGVQGGEA